MDRSLKRLMRISRGRFRNRSLPVTPPYVPPTPPTGYVLADFGENAINNHSTGVDWHSAKNQVIFNYITSNFRNRCTSFESYKTATLGNSMVSDKLDACKKVGADIVYTPYVNSAVSSNTDNDNFIITVGSHYDNDGQFDAQIGADNNRHDLTANSTTFLSDSIAVSARRDTPELFKNSTSEGFGMEFFEDCSNEYLSEFYPNKDIATAFAELLTNDGSTLFSNVHLTFTNYISVGEAITIRFTSNPESWITTTVTDIVDGNHITVYPSISPITNGGVYVWHDVTLGEYIGAQEESWAVPLTAGKLKVIKMTTGANWDTVRAAARATAKRNATGIPEIDNANWDIWRGFGCINVNDAISYINNNLQ